jgi:hypothetical protein
MPSKQFLNYRACINHTPAALAGHDEPTAILARTRNMFPELPKPDPIPEPLATVTPITTVPGANDLSPVERSRAAGEARAAQKERTAEMKALARASIKATG